MSRRPPMTRLAGFLFFLVPVLSFGCTDIRPVRDTPTTVSTITEDIPVFQPVQVDILLVVDDSASMADDQTLLGEAIPALILDLLAPPLIDYDLCPSYSYDPADPGCAPDPPSCAANPPAASCWRPHQPVRDVHLGVISTDMGVGGRDIPTCRNNPLSGDDGLLVHATGHPSCSEAYPDYLSYGINVEDDPDEELVGRIAWDFGCMAVLGAGGCGFEQPLEAAVKALTVNMADGGRNTGFLRKNSILLVLFITDEDDCSVADPSIFDGEEAAGDDSLRCRQQSWKLFSIEHYVRAFIDLKGGADYDGIPYNLLFGFIVGVPPVPDCEGRGDEIPYCLELPSMQEGEDPFEGVGEGDCPATAAPARRLVTLAQEFGDNAAVMSLCRKSFLRASEALTEKLREAILDVLHMYRYLPLAKDPLDPCRCEAKCTITEEMKAGRSCPPGKDPVDADGDTLGDMAVDFYTGLQQSLCTIPQAGTLIDDCTLDCGDPRATHTKDPERPGWWFNPYAISTHDHDGDTMPDVGPSLLFGDMHPEVGSGVSITCRSVLCPALQMCGAAFEPYGTCCDDNEYCWRPVGHPGEAGVCLLRRDVCEEYGADLWCEGAGTPEVEAMAGGVCCLDPDMDGKLDWRLEDIDGDGAGDFPVATLFRCEGSRCVTR